MSNSEAALSALDEPGLRAEILRLNKVIQALMDRAERTGGSNGSDFDRFHTTVIWEELVERRTQELAKALRENEKTNRALRETEQKFHSVLDQSLVGITMMVEDSFHYVNLKFAGIIGYSVDEILRMRPTDIADGCDESFARETARLLAGEIEQISFVADAKRKDGQVITVEVSGNSSVSIAGKQALIAVWVDITERLRNERAVQLLQEQLREQATRDPLTGLYNRLFLNESLARELLQAKRLGQSISVVMADLDHFKAINDRHGHLAGDEALKHFAAIMKRYSRGSDISCRYGGEEFFWVLPNTTEATAYERANELRMAIAAESVLFNSATITITASFGVAAYPAGGMTCRELIASADAALYAAKHAGRNQVRCISQCFTTETGADTSI
jgi:diguanylate cyclase (GGDEF)-like protein/PAS domain S-box-containing protein